MYDELVKRLRVSVDGRYEKCDVCPYEEDYPCCVDCLDKMHKEAADAIEELQKRVPKVPHGRLIDADALMARFEKEEKAADEHGRDFSFSFKSAGENCAEWWSVQQMLFYAPTIIPAEEGE